MLLQLCIQRRFPRHIIQRHKKRNRSYDSIMIDAWTGMESSIFPFLKFTNVIAENHLYGAVPVLVIKV